MLSQVFPHVLPLNTQVTGIVSIDFRLSYQLIFHFSGNKRNSFIIHLFEQGTVGLTVPCVHSTKTNVFALFLPLRYFFFLYTYFVYIFSSMCSFLRINLITNSTPRVSAIPIGSEMYHCCTKPAMM